MDIQILNIAELLLFVFMICTCIRIYRQKKQKGKKKGIKHSTNITIDGTRARGFEGIGKSPKADSYIFTRY